MLSPLLLSANIGGAVDPEQLADWAEANVFRYSGGAVPGRWDRRVVANFWKIFARFRLYRHRPLQENTRFSAFFKIYHII